MTTTMTTTTTTQLWRRRSAVGRGGSGISRVFVTAAVVATLLLDVARCYSVDDSRHRHPDDDDDVVVASPVENKMSNANIIPGENDKEFWIDVGNDLLRKKLKQEYRLGVAKNVIFFLGDGMSITTLVASRIYKGQLENKTGENEMLSFEKFPFTGLSKTYCVNSQVADSACSATAYLTGVKGNIHTVGVSGSVAKRDCVAGTVEANRAVSSMVWAQRAGKRTGVVTNMRVTHATPAGAYAGVAYREWECDGDIAADDKADPSCVTRSSDIARQLIENEAGRNLNVIMGGGRSKFLPNTTKDWQNKSGQRIDNRNLIKEWLNINRAGGARTAYVNNRTELKSLKTNETDYLFGLFASSHMTYNLLADKTVEPTLVEMVEAAVEVLSKGDDGYYLFVEGGNIDWSHHDNNARVALDETVMLSNAVARAVELTSRDDTLIVVTSDHSHTMTLNGYPKRGSDILGHPQTANGDNMPYSTLSYANGPYEARAEPTSCKRYNLTRDNDTHDALYRFPAMVKMDSETHGGDDVGVFALGPWAHLFVGNYEQNYIPYAISYAANMGPGAKVTDRSPPHMTTTAAAAAGPGASGLLASAAFCALALRAIG